MPRCNSRAWAGGVRHDPHALPLRGSLPPEGADPAWGGPAPDRMNIHTESLDDIRVITLDRSEVRNAVEDGHLRQRVVLEGEKGRVQFARGGRVHGVAHLGAVQGDDADVV